MDGAADVFAFVEHGKDLVNHGSDDVVFAGELAGRAGGGVAFGDGQRAGGDGGGLFAFANPFAEAAVAGSLLAATIAVGISRATSMAKVGPDRAADLACGAFSASTPHMVRPVSYSMPLVTLTTTPL